MPYIPYTEKEKQLANGVDLAEFLRIRGEKLERAGREFKLIYHDGSGKHDSITISGSKWFDHKNQIGGGAIKFMRHFYGMDFPTAMHELLGKSVSPIAHSPPKAAVPDENPKEFRLPKANENMHRVYAYLIKQRFIAPEIITHFAKKHLLFEDKSHHNAVFVGMDEKDNPKYAAIRGIGTSFIGEANGSDKNYSFSIFTEKSCDTVHLFESAIDLLSYATVLKLDGKEWRIEHLLSLAGVYQPAKEIEKSKVPAALARALKMHPEVKTIVLHLDNDRIGRLATKAISTVLSKQYLVKDVPPKQGKDYNDQLCIKLNLVITKREKNTKKSMSGHEKYER